MMTWRFGSVSVEQSEEKGGTASAEAEVMFKMSIDHLRGGHACMWILGNCW